MGKRFKETDRQSEHGEQRKQETKHIDRNRRRKKKGKTDIQTDKRVLKDRERRWEGETDERGTKIKRQT